MSITDPLEVYYYERRGTYLILRGRETFYEDDTMLEWETAEEAIEWARENHSDSELIMMEKSNGLDT